MKFNFNTPITDYEGKELKTENKTVTFKEVIINSLQTIKPDTDAAERGQLFATSVKVTGEGDLEAEDITLIKKYVGLNCIPLAVGRVDEFLTLKS